MSKFNLKILLAIISGIISVVVKVLSEGSYNPSDDTENNVGGA